MTLRGRRGSLGDLRRPQSEELKDARARRPCVCLRLSEPLRLDELRDDCIEPFGGVGDSHELDASIGGFAGGSIGQSAVGRLTERWVAVGDKVDLHTQWRVTNGKNGV